MKSFKWCVWLMPSERHSWNSLTNGFPIHLTLNSFLEKEEVESFLSGDFNSVYLNLQGSPIAEYGEDFSALYYHVSPVQPWFPENPHVSFYYSYGQSLETVSVCGGALFHQIAIANCSGHFRSWTYETRIIL